MMSCKEATLLASKKEEGRITLVERVKLAIHMFICVYCKRFVQQTNVIAHKAKQEIITHQLPEKLKQDINKVIKGD